MNKKLSRPYCKHCGSQIKKKIIEIQKYSLTIGEWRYQEFDGEVLRKFRVPIPRIDMNDCFDEKSGEKRYEKIIYCEKGCLQKKVDEGTKKEIYKRKKVASDFSWKLI